MKYDDSIKKVIDELTAEYKGKYYSYFNDIDSSLTCYKIKKFICPSILDRLRDLGMEIDKSDYRREYNNVNNIFEFRKKWVGDKATTNGVPTQS